MKKIVLWVSLLAVISAGPGCGGRTPSPGTSQRIIKKHFKKYGKKYKESDFGQYKLDRVEVTEMEEVQKNWAAVQGFTYLSSGGPVYRVRVTLQKKALGWRYVQWENLGKR